MTNPEVRISVDTEANAAYVELGDGGVSTTVQVNDEVLVDLDEHGVVVGIEVLRIDADLPFDLLTNRFHVHSSVIELLRVLKPSVGGFLSVTLSHGHDGNADQTAQHLALV